MIRIERAVVLAIHQEQLAEHGGGVGLRDLRLLESALARPLERAAYRDPDAAALAAACGVGLAQNHPFVDDDKRTAFVAVELFLALDHHRLLAAAADCVLTMLAVAAGELDEAGFADWIRCNSARR